MFMEKYQQYPEILFVQVDGGSENANKYVLAFLELLVSECIIKEAWYTRLPVGHTHEDLDACFGNISKAFRHKCCHTFRNFDTVVKECFGKTLDVTIKDIFVAPYYSWLLEECIDPRLSKLHRQEQTQLQWRFVAVPPSPNFPFGCKVTYRCYSADAVIELEKKNSNECLSRIGQRTGLKPVLVYVQWYPSPTCDLSCPGITGEACINAVCVSYLRAY
jgi:hypothetical protein